MAQLGYSQKKTYFGRWGRGYIALVIDRSNQRGGAAFVDKAIGVAEALSGSNLAALRDNLKSNPAYGELRFEDGPRLVWVGSLSPSCTGRGVTIGTAGEPTLTIDYEVDADNIRGHIAGRDPMTDRPFAETFDAKATDFDSLDLFIASIKRSELVFGVGVGIATIGAVAFAAGRNWSRIKGALHKRRRK